MKKVIIIGLIFFVFYKGWHKGPLEQINRILPEQFASMSSSEAVPLYDYPYIVVYGRNTCGYTKRTLKALKKHGVNFEYKNLDDKRIKESLIARMTQSGLDTRRYKLPVVDVNNDISTRPSTQSILENYFKSSI